MWRSRASTWYLMSIKWLLKRLQLKSVAGVFLSKVSTTSKYWIQMRRNNLHDTPGNIQQIFTIPQNIFYITDVNLLRWHITNMLWIKLIWITMKITNTFLIEKKRVSISTWNIMYDKAYFSYFTVSWNFQFKRISSQ